MPAGAYELKLKVAVTGDRPIRLKVAIEPSEGSHSDPLAATEVSVPATGSSSVVTVPWTSDGARSFKVSVAAHADTGRARLLVSAIDAGRVWPMVAGSPRYYEPSLVGRSDR
jgi:hypothetical protein